MTTPLVAFTTQGVALYRHFDTRGELLYVGITDDPARRWMQHLETSVWVCYVATAHVQWYPHRAAAREAERAAIRHEQPIFNTARASRKAAARVRARYLQTGSSGLFRRVPCRAVADEFCIACGPDADAWFDSLEVRA